jgi:hypothetical protein
MELGDKIWLSHVMYDIRVFDAPSSIFRRYEWSMQHTQPFQPKACIALLE